MISFLRRRDTSEPNEVLARGDLERALVLFRGRARRSAAEAARSHEQAGHILERLHRPAEAIDEYLLAIDLYARRERAAPVLALCTDLARLAPGHPELMRWIDELTAPAPEGLTGPAGRPGLATRPPLFSELGGERLRELLPHLLVRHHDAGGCLFAEGAPADRLLLLVRGEAALTLDDPFLGWPVEVGRRGEGALLGRVRPQETLTWPLTALATRATETLELPRTDVVALAARTPRLWAIVEAAEGDLAAVEA
jgi:hypothetical protein